MVFFTFVPKFVNVDKYCNVFNRLHTKVNLECSYRLQLHWLLLPPLPRASWVEGEEEEAGFHQQNSRKRSASLVGVKMGRISCKKKGR